MRVLITGVSGFAGSHLLEFLVRKSHQDYHSGGDGIEIFGADRWNVTRENVAGLGRLYQHLEFDLADYGSVLRTIREARPDRIFHLAAQSFVPTSWRAPEEAIRTNVIGELNLLEAVREAGLDPLIQVACSSEEYGLVAPDEIPIRETNPLRPLSPYAVSKVGQDMLGYQYHKSYGLRVVRTRAFNHTGPRRGEQFATSNFARQIAWARAGLSEPFVLVGNLDAVRDLTDVRDVVRAYWLALERGTPGEVYNVCSGAGVSMAWVLRTLMEIAGVGYEVRQDPARLRPSDVPILVGDSSRFRDACGWAPAIPLRTTLADLMEYWARRAEAMLS